MANALICIGDVFSDGFGGSSGPLWGVFISQGATKLKPKLADNTKEDWINAYNEGLKAMMKVGGAEKGDRTMVDALIFGQEYLAKGELDFQKLAEATRAGAEYAKSITANKGRSAYIGDQVIGKPDPGCELTALIF